MGFGDLKKQSSLGSLTAKLVKEVEKQNGGGQGYYGKHPNEKCRP